MQMKDRLSERRKEWPMVPASAPSEAVHAYFREGFVEYTVRNFNGYNILIPLIFLVVLTDQMVQHTSWNLPTETKYMDSTRSIGDTWRFPALGKSF